MGYCSPSHTLNNYPSGYSANLFLLQDGFEVYFIRSICCKWARGSSLHSFSSSLPTRLPSSAFALKTKLLTRVACLSRPREARAVTPERAIECVTQRPDPKVCGRADRPPSVPGTRPEKREWVGEGWRRERRGEWGAGAGARQSGLSALRPGTGI